MAADYDSNIPSISDGTIGYTGTVGLQTYDVSLSCGETSTLGIGSSDSGQHNITVGATRLEA